MLMSDTDTNRQGERLRQNNRKRERGGERGMGWEGE